MADDGGNAQQVVASLVGGGVLLLSTDTVPGLHCRCDRPDAVARLVRIKGRPADQPLLVLAGSLAQAMTVLGELRPDQRAACERCWPGPFTLILPAARAVSRTLTGGGDGLGVRVPAHRALRELILAVGVPLVSTSANRAGQEPAGEMHAATRSFAGDVDGIWEGLATGQATAAVPSALVDLTVAPFRVLRSGPQEFPAT